MNLKNFYNKLERQMPPKTKFVKEIASLCSVTEATARNWIKYGVKPTNPEHVKIISEKTGIPETDLWK